jgi:hypothetical protein
MGKFKIEHSNTDVKKLWMLARNGVFSHKTVTKIFASESTQYIVFHSKRSYEKYKEFQYSSLAMYPM